VPGHRSPVVAEILGDDEFYLFRSQTLSLQFLAEFLSMVSAQSMGPGVAIAEGSAGCLHVALVGAVPILAVLLLVYAFSEFFKFGH